MKMNKIRIFFNVVGFLFIIGFFSLILFSLHEAEKKANDPNTPPEERERIQNEITSALLHMG